MDRFSYADHADLLAQVASSEHERNTVRRILGDELQRDLRRLPKLTESDSDAHESDRMPLPAEAATDVGAEDEIAIDTLRAATWSAVFVIAALVALCIVHLIAMLA